MTWKIISFYNTDNQRLVKKESRANTSNKGYFSFVHHLNRSRRMVDVTKPECHETKDKMMRISTNKPRVIKYVKNNQNKHWAQPWVSTGLGRSVQKITVIPNLTNTNFLLDFGRKDVFECYLCALRGANFVCSTQSPHVGGRSVLLLPKPVYLA